MRDHLSGKIALGRFGWKAQNATIRDQSASALATDIGISNPDRPNAFGDCTDKEPALPRHADRRAKTPRRYGSTRSDPRSRDLLFAKPRRSGPPQGELSRNVARQADFLRKRLHRLSHAEIRDAQRRRGGGAILPADLALFRLPAARHGRRPCRRSAGRRGNRPRVANAAALGYRADPNRERPHASSCTTAAPGHLTEAILWHGGEAEKARNAFASLAKDDRDALITFLESL